MKSITTVILFVSLLVAVLVQPGFSGILSRDDVSIQDKVVMRLIQGMVNDASRKIKDEVLSDKLERCQMAVGFPTVKEEQFEYKMTDAEIFAEVRDLIVELATMLENADYKKYVANCIIALA